MEPFARHTDASAQCVSTTSGDKREAILINKWLPLFEISISVLRVGTRIIRLKNLNVRAFIELEVVEWSHVEIDSEQGQMVLQKILAKNEVC